MINLVIVPFHDYRKNLAEGFRSRDAHFIEHFARNRKVDKIVIINRPITFVEGIHRGLKWKTKGAVVLKRKNAQLVQVNEKLFVIDYLSNDNLGAIALGKKWFWKAYSEKRFISFVEECVNALELKNPVALFQNLYASSLIKLFASMNIVLDAFDNWLRMPANNRLSNQIKASYAEFARYSRLWVTNSEENKEYYCSQFNVQQCLVIKNGVDIERFQSDYELPHDMSHIKNKIIGFAGKITHLLDVELFNYLTINNPEYSFVIVGQILDKKVFNSIQKRNNFYYLGDKHYDQYPAYLKHFDLCIIPYVDKMRSHGGDSIKFYEYVAAGKKVVATRGNGVYQMNSNIYIAESIEEFQHLLKKAMSSTNNEFHLPENITWKYKTEYLLDHIIPAQSELN